MDTRPSKRRKTPLACENCRRQKIKCDGDRPVCGIFLVAHFDRSNMSNALVLGLKEDTDLSGDRFNVALSMYVPQPPPPPTIAPCWDRCS
jgi:Zn(2)-Cys(6) binuclear cluster domain-containing protein